MWRFVLKENIRRFASLMAHARTDTERERFSKLLEASELELAEIEEASTPEIARRDVSLSLFAERVVDEVMTLHSAQFSSLQIFDESREHLIILAQRNFRASFLHHLAQLEPGDGSALGRCLQNNAPALIADVNEDAAFEPHRKAATEAGFQAVHASPVRNGSGELIAVLSTYFSTPQNFLAKEVHAIEAYARSVGSNLDRLLQR